MLSPALLLEKIDLNHVYHFHPELDGRLIFMFCVRTFTSPAASCSYANCCGADYYSLKLGAFS